MGGPIQTTGRLLRGARDAAGAVRGRGPLPAEARQLLDDDRFGAALAEAAGRAGQPVGAAREEATGYLREMAADHRESLGSRWRQFGDWFMRAYDVWVDEEEIDRLRRLDKRYSLGLAFAHRSYLDGFVVPGTLGQRRFSPTYTFGGANLDLPVIGSLASRTGIIFIRRSTGDLPLYRLTLRHYVTQLVRNRRNLTWSIEGGRTRTGKLRPPVHGILKYLTDAVEEGSDEATDVMIVPVSIVYDQLHELTAMTAEARGAKKTPEDLRWMVRFARQQRHRLGRAYLSVGEPFSLRERYDELLAEGNTDKQAVERIALDVSHRLNRATPVTVTAIVSLAVLGADRSLTLDEVLDTVRRLAAYIEARDWPVAGAADLTDRNTIRRALQELVASGVLTCFDGGTEPVWGIGEDQHLVAAFYRNTAIHMLVERAIGEIVLLAISEARLAGDEDATRVGWEEAKRLRDLLKFEFFFSARDEFERELRAELEILAPDHHGPLTPEVARDLLERARPHLAHLVLRPFLDAYAVLADRLAAADDEIVDTDALLAETLQVGRQWALQRRIANAESVTLELFRTALALARHRGLLPEQEEYGLGAARRAFADEIAEVVRRLRVIADLDQQAGGES